MIKIKWTAVILLVVISINFTACQKKPLRLENPLNGRTTAVFNPNKTYGTVTDIDGNIYKTIKIGDQVWMAENLRTTHYRNGDAIPNVTEDSIWGSQETGAYCNYNNTEDLDTIATYGRLYNWYAVNDSRGLAPKGWHVPDINDWLILIDNLGGDTIASKHLKEAGDFHWVRYNVADNSSGFTALPGGWRYLSEKTIKISFYGAWWVSTEYNSSSAAFLDLFVYDTKVWKGFNYKQNGYSVRCIKDKS